VGLAVASGKRSAEVPCARSSRFAVIANTRAFDHPATDGTVADVPILEPNFGHIFRKL
jgi:hypothetical protein